MITVDVMTCSEMCVFSIGADTPTHPISQSEISCVNVELIVTAYQLQPNAL